MKKVIIALAGILLVGWAWRKWKRLDIDLYTDPRDFGECPFRSKS